MEFHFCPSCEQDPIVITLEKVNEFCSAQKFEGNFPRLAGLK